MLKCSLLTTIPNNTFLLPNIIWESPQLSRRNLSVWSSLELLIYKLLLLSSGWCSVKGKNQTHFCIFYSGKMPVLTENFVLRQWLAFFRNVLTKCFYQKMISLHAFLHTEGQQQHQMAKTFKTFYQITAETFTSVVYRHSLPSCRPGFESQSHHIRFFIHSHICTLFALHCEKEAGLGAY